MGLSPFAAEHMVGFEGGESRWTERSYRRQPGEGLKG
jgi:hypothetical protein